PRHPDRPEIEAALADQGAESNENRPGGNQEGNKGKRLAECQGADDRRRPQLVGAREFDDLLGESVDLIFERHGDPAGGGAKRAATRIPAFPIVAGCASTLWRHSWVRLRRDPFGGLVWAQAVSYWSL